jgi:lysozyme
MEVSMTDEKPVAPSRPIAKPTALALAAGVACAGICAPLVSHWEDGGQQHLVAYHGRADAPGIWTICGGDTIGVKPGDRETPAGCSIRIDKRLAEHVKPVLTATPGLKGHPYQLAAAISLAFNIGDRNYAHSTAARLFNLRKWSDACDAFTLFDKANGKVVKGLQNRRTDPVWGERTVCLTGLPA